MGTVYELPIVTGFSVTPPFSSQTTEANITLIHNNGLLMQTDGSLYGYIGSSISGVTVAFWVENNRLQRIEKQGPTNQYRCYSVHQWPYVASNESLELSYYVADEFLYASSGLLNGTIEVDLFDNRDEAERAIGATTLYPITYHYTNSVVSGPSEAAVGDAVTVSAVPDVGYGITDATTQILVTNDDVAVPYTWDAATNRIMFTMPQSAENRGGFGSAGQ